MKRRRPKPANFDYDFTNLAVEVTGDALYLINGGAEIENSIAAQANAQVGDTVTNSRGETHTLTQGDINWAKEKIGSSGQNTGSSTPSSQPTTTSSKTDISGYATAQEALKALGCNTESSARPSLTSEEIDTIMQRNPEAYVSREELLAEWEHANNKALGENPANKSGIGFGFKSIDAAALYWAKTYGDDSIITGQEFTSAIFAYDSVVEQEDGSTKRETRYFYNKPNEGYEKWKNGLCYKRCDISWEQNCYTNGNGIENIRIVSAIHSHGDNLYGESQRASIDDREGVDKIKELFDTHIGREYVVLPDGRLSEFKGKADFSTVTISGDCLYDIRAELPYGFTEYDYFGKEIFNLYKNTYYHPDEFFAYNKK